MTLVEKARQLLALLYEMKQTGDYSDPAKLLEMKTLNMGLGTVYARLYGNTPLIVTEYPVRIWHSRALERASDALAWLEAHPGWESDAIARAASEGERMPERDETASPTRTSVCFVLMPFSDDFDWLRAELMSAGADVGVEIRRADDIFRAGVIIDQVKQEIRGADAVLAVCTGRNPNVFYELGLSDGLHEAILVAEDKDDLPFDVAHLRAIFYGGDGPPNDRASLRARLGQALQQTIAGRRQARREAPLPLVGSRAVLNARVRASGGNPLMDVVNQGDVPILEVSWELRDPQSAWVFLNNELPSYPVPRLDPGDIATVPVIVAEEMPSSVELWLRGKTEAGHDYERLRTISQWG